VASISPVERSSRFAADWDRPRANCRSRRCGQDGPLRADGRYAFRRWGGSVPIACPISRLHGERSLRRRRLANMMAATTFPIARRPCATASLGTEIKILRPPPRPRARRLPAESSRMSDADAANLTPRAVQRATATFIDCMKNFIHPGPVGQAARSSPSPYAQACQEGSSVSWPHRHAGHRVRGWKEARHRTCDPADHAWTGWKCRRVNMWARPARGSRSALSSLAYGRIGVAAQSVGVAALPCDRLSLMPAGARDLRRR